MKTIYKSKKALVAGWTFEESQGSFAVTDASEDEKCKLKGRYIRQVKLSVLE